MAPHPFHTLTVVVDTWPYGAIDETTDQRRYFQGLCFAQDTRSANPDANFYAYPLPLIPVLDMHTKEIVRVDKLPTGGCDSPGSGPADVLGHWQAADYVPELLRDGTRRDLNPIDMHQPEGPSFRVTDESLVEWQKWRFRVSFNPREGAVVHDVHYDGRSVLYWLSISEMTVPYADPRPPFHRKQAFDLGDGAAGYCTNNLVLGCDCVGAVRNLDGRARGRRRRAAQAGQRRVHPRAGRRHRVEAHQLAHGPDRCGAAARARGAVCADAGQLRVRLRLQVRRGRRHGRRGARHGRRGLARHVRAAAVCERRTWSLADARARPRLAQTLQLLLQPADFFAANPALDVPSAANTASVLVGRSQSADAVPHGTDSGLSVLDRGAGVE